MSSREFKADKLIRELQGLGNKEIAEHSQRFFKIGKGEYGEGDVFLGIRVPVVRQRIRPFLDMGMDELQQLLACRYHEVRLSALLILVEQFKKGDQEKQREIYTLYLENIRYVNNWDLVDCSAPHIVGGYLTDRDKEPLSRLVRSESIWERRIAIMACFHFIRQGDYEKTLELAMLLLGDSEDLIHKAAGWMLREIGKRDIQVEREFLAQYYKQMPRTMLRYAIEKFPEVERKMYLRGEI